MLPRPGGDCARCVDFSDRLANSYALREVERNRHGRKLAQVVHAQRTQARPQTRNSAQRNQCSAAGAHIQKRKSRRIPLILVLQKHHDPIFVIRRVDSGNLPLSVGCVKGVLYLLHAFTPKAAALSR